ncbi:MAG TPA: hypothetical protein VFA65_01520 [Bryobacteraceae bacterium]|nr:hypothetical protein [Bryobacteraceae bacterium]
MRKKHLIVLGVTNIRQHLRFFNVLAGVFAGQCALFCAQARWQQTPSPEASCLILPVTDLSARAFLALFLPDNTNTRVAVALAMTFLSKENSLAETLSRMTMEGPIVLLDDPAKPDDMQMHSDYAVFCEALKMTFEGRTHDVRLN